MICSVTGYDIPENDNFLKPDMGVKVLEVSNLDASQLRQLEVSARKYYSDHSDHVDVLMQTSSIKVPPSGSDIFKPELWKSIHWNWFMSQEF